MSAPTSPSPVDDSTLNKEPTSDVQPQTAPVEDPSKDSSPDSEADAQAEAEPQAEPEPTASTSTETAAIGNTGIATAGDWQAIWSPAHNAYYFFNAATQQTTWENPLVPTSAGPSASAASSSSAAMAPGLSQMYALQEAALAQGIDPALAHLDPSLAGSSSSSAGYAAHAKFNARTGAFTAPDARAPEHLSEYERAKRMSSVYFDVGAWEAEVAARKQQEKEDEENGKKRKRPSKKDLERFKEQKRLKKIAKTAWLRT